ncbi:DUF6087 family protein [Streptomyces mirabilis]|uniref:DUF6087 family protein n=1 Tax=Streptomyces mirabilis TaxID=68239 RepID=UPI0022588D5D|nr:DUF6087 family protein [Streptomyces mirabilis]MCX4426335.1 DUF6087 family protein [Streptomyces mirabilis]
MLPRFTTGSRQGRPRESLAAAGAARRCAERRNASERKRRAPPLTSGPNRGTHVEPDAPRVIEEWNGTERVTVSVGARISWSVTERHLPDVVTYPHGY